VRPDVKFEVFENRVEFSYPFQPKVVMPFRAIQSIHYVPFTRCLLVAGSGFNRYGIPMDDFEAARIMATLAPKL
jgi:hypothetical protein